MWMGRSAEKELTSSPVTANHPAFAMRSLTGYDVATWQMNEGLTNWDALFALGFTSYQALLAFLKDSVDTPVDEVRELLVRLYLVEPTYPMHFQTPNMQDLVDFLFNLSTNDSTLGAESRKKSASLLAQLLGRNRGSGYRWLRAAEHAENSVAMPIRRLSSKVFSMDPKMARTYFWRAARSMAAARGFSMDAIDEMLRSNGVKID
jgi:hypothetical protein